MSANKIVITTAQIIEAYSVHGNDFIVINFDSCRKYKNYAQYIDIDIRLADGSVKPIRYWKLSNEGIVAGSRIRKPEQRKYESIRLGITLRSTDDDTENENAKALQLLCTAFEETMNKMKSDEVITDNSSRVRKQADGSYRPFLLISTKIVTPMQLTAIDKETEEIKELDNPFFWISIPKKKFFKNEDKKEAVQYEDKFYADESGHPDTARPVFIHEYAPEFYNVDDAYYHPRTGKKTYKLLGAEDSETRENRLDNTNIQDYITRGSALMGNLKFEIAVSGRQCKLDVSLYGKTYVKVAEQQESGISNEDNENIDAFSSKYSKLSMNTKTKEEGDDEHDFDDGDIE